MLNVCYVYSDLCLLVRERNMIPGGGSGVQLM